ncbi:HYC_CC_PP family protein [Winogradskyella flava]|uniref:HYC_CC_PP family protein n=1 Tax=Winogradskyella flava TaxID=1884876 RepID=UPI003CD0D3A9
MVKCALTYKLFSVTLSFLVLFSTLSLTVEKHFCGNTLVDTSIFSESKKCGMEFNEMESETQSLKKSCCKDEIDVLKGQDEIVLKTFDDLDDIQKQVLFAFTYAYFNLYESLPKEITPHKDYSPPLLVKNIQALDETYLI